MTETNAVSITEDRIPAAGIEQAIDELVDVYGGEVSERGDRTRRFVLPLRRGVAAAGGIECTLSWSVDEAGEATVTLDSDHSIDAPKTQRVLMLVAGVVGALLFMLWPFFPHQKEFGTLAWLGGIIALAVYFMSLRKTSGGIAHDFVQRLAARQRSQHDA